MAGFFRLQQKPAAHHQRRMRARAQVAAPWLRQLFKPRNNLNCLCIERTPMKLTWLCAFTLLSGIAACSRNDENPPKSAPPPPPQVSAPSGVAQVSAVETQVLRLANTLANAAESNDLKNLMAAFSKDVKISIGGANSTPRVFTYATYEAYLASALPLVSAYKYQRFSESIQTAGDEIIFRFILNESYQAQGQSISQAHTEIWHLRQGPTGLLIHKVFIEP